MGRDSAPNYRLSKHSYQPLVRSSKLKMFEVLINKICFSYLDDVIDAQFFILMICPTFISNFNDVAFSPFTR